jgi:beta-barrel assembly-enhancing protease
MTGRLFPHLPAGPRRAKVDRIHKTAVWALALTLAATTVSTQTRIQAPKNSYKVTDDVKLGQEAAAEARKELPMLNDERVDQYVESIGARLAAAIPPEFQHPEFKFTFDVVNQSEINAFALPGGPMFLNRGMIEKSKAEAEMAGVMAHELSHVALRHGTAQASKQTLPGIASIGGQILGGILGGGLGQAIGVASQVGAAAWSTKYSREFESQADILGAQMLARAGYDPREMANMFKTIEAEGGGGGPEWLSSHPNPGNRYNAINKEASTLKVQGKGETGQFASVQARLGDLGPSYTAEQIAKGQHKNGGGPRPTATAGRTVKVSPPSTALRTDSPANFLRVGVPSNWNRLDSRDSATYVPDGASFEGHFTHGVQFGVTQATGDLRRDTAALIQNFARSNPELRQGSVVRDTVDGRQALTATLQNVSDVTGQPEQVFLTTTELPNNNLFFMVGVAPQSETNVYSATFRQIRQSVRFNAR